MKVLLLTGCLILSATCLIAQGHYNHGDEEFEEGSVRRIDQLLQRSAKSLNSNPHRARGMAHHALRMSHRHGYKQGLAKAHGLMAKTFMAQAVHGRALDHFLRQLNLYQNEEDWLGITNTYNQIALLYRRQLKPEKTFEYSALALDLAEKFNFEEEIALAHNNIGIAHYYNKAYQKALQYFGHSIQLREKLNLTKGLIISYNNMGLILSNLSQYTQALKWYEKSLHINIGKNEIKHMKAATLDNIGDVLVNEGKHKEARKYYIKALKIAKEAEANMRIIETYESFYKLSAKEENHKEALKFHILYTTLKDSLLSANADVQIASLQHRFERVSERKERALLEKDLNLQRATAHRHKVISLGTVIGLGLMFLLAFVLYRSSRKDRKARRLMGEQSEEIQEINRLLVKSREKLLTKTEMVTLQNQQVTSSIRAAKLIQSAILPFDRRMKQILGNYFLLYLPKDIVSGDFYWTYQIGKVRYVAVADCTGHGVAGSLMSMLGYALLNEIVNRGILEPAQILQHLNKKLTASLRQNITKNQAGMDIVLCKIEPAPVDSTNKPQFKVTYASSRRPLYYTEQKKLKKVKGDKQFIGGHFSHYEPRPFKEYSIMLNKGESLYLTSDGYADTPNKEREAFGSRRFFELIQKSSYLPLEGQKELFENTLEIYHKEPTNAMILLFWGLPYRLLASPMNRDFGVASIGFWLLAFGFWLLAFGFWLLAFGFWLLAFGFWLLAFGFSCFAGKE